MIMTLSEFYKLYLDMKSDLRPKTKQISGHGIKLFVKFVGDKPLDQNTFVDAEHFKKCCLSADLSPTSVNMYFRSLKAIFSHSLNMELLEKSPFRNSTTIRLPERTPVFMTKVDLQKLYEKVTNPVLRDLFEIASLTGLRLSEIVNLTWAQVDFEKRQIRVTGHDGFQTKTGKIKKCSNAHKSGRNTETEEPERTVCICQV